MSRLFRVGDVVHAAGDVRDEGVVAQVTRQGVVVAWDTGEVDQFTRRGGVLGARRASGLASVGGTDGRVVWAGRVVSRATALLRLEQALAVTGEGA